MANTLLLKNARVLATMDDQRRELRDGCVFIRGNAIEAVGTLADMPHEADETLDLSGHVVMPGMINTHHHMFQTLTRALPGAQDSELFDWLSVLFPVWARVTPEMMRVATQIAMAELLLSGCTTSMDHAYLYVNGIRLEDSIEAAHEIGLRFHAARGAMSLGQSAGGLPPDSVVEQDEALILRDMRRVIEAHHDANRYAMLRIAVAPCSPFTVTRDLMREAAQLARSYGVGLHTHLAENWKDVAFSREKYHATPTEYAEELGWVGRDVWHAHCVHLDEAGIRLFARTGTGVAHCPCSNMRLASGIAPVRRMRDAGISVGLGVDGSASNDSGQMLAEARTAMLLARVNGNVPGALPAREALEIATRGGAAVLGRDDIGQIAPGYAADLIAFRLDTLGLAGGQHDPIAALVLCNPGNVDLSIINGQVVVRNGELQTVELPQLIARHNRLAATLT